MSDENIAAIARQLANALARAGYERDQQSKQQVAALHTELCQAVRAEAAENAAEQK